MAIGLDFGHGVAMPCAEVAPAHDQLQREAWISGDGGDQVAKQAVFGAAPGEHGDGPLSRLVSHRSLHRADSCAEPGGPAAVGNAWG